MVKSGLFTITWVARQECKAGEYERVAQYRDRDGRSAAVDVLPPLFALNSEDRVGGKPAAASPHAHRSTQPPSTNDSEHQCTEHHERGYDHVIHVPFMRLAPCNSSPLSPAERVEVVRYIARIVHGKVGEAASNVAGRDRDYRARYEYAADSQYGADRAEC